MSPPPPEASAAGDSSLDVVMSAVDHSADQISQEAIEQLEMRRLGLPLSFGSRKNRRAKRKKKDE